MIPPITSSHPKRSTEASVTSPTTPRTMRPTPRATNQPEWRLTSRLVTGSRPIEKTAACSMAQLLPRPTDGSGNSNVGPEPGRAQAEGGPPGRLHSKFQIQELDEHEQQVWM